MEDLTRDDEIEEYEDGNKEEGSKREIPMHEDPKQEGRRHKKRKNEDNRECQNFIEESQEDKEQDKVSKKAISHEERQDIYDGDDRSLKN